ncbi:unnamed protein product [Lampetra fluviatilis]
MSGWTDEEVLRAIPETLDNDALATLITTPKSARATLKSALQLLATVYGPPSDCHLGASKGYIHANLLSQRRATNKAAAVHTVTATARSSEEVFAASRPAEWRSGGRPAWDVPSHREQPKPTGVLTICYNCGFRGYMASGCRAPRQRRARPRADDAPFPKSPQ